MYITKSLAIPNLDKSDCIKIVNLSDYDGDSIVYRTLKDIIRLADFDITDDELLALISRVTRLYAQNYNWTPRITDEEMVVFLNICLERAGANSMITPREMLRDYMTLLNILMQNPEVSFYDIVGTAVTLKTPDEIEEEAETERVERSGAENPSAGESAAEKGALLEERRRYTPDDIEF